MAHRRTFPLLTAVAGAAAALVLSTPAYALTDSDRDGIPNRWERNHGMDPRDPRDARADFDKDGLRNLGEYRKGTLLRDEDTDNDGHDDGDEVHDGRSSTQVRDRDTDDDGVRDGDEDADRDGLDNEDEDDAVETCRRDDDDRDRDSVSDEDENELGTRSGDADSDDDGVRDGDEDRDHDGEANEDEDDSDDDACFPDSDGDGECDEDDADLLGTITSFDAETGALVVETVNGDEVTGTVTDATEIDFEDDGVSEDPGEATVGDLLPGVQVAELEYDEDTGDLEEVEIYPPVG